MTDAEIAERLRELEAVFTPSLRVRNEVVRVLDDAVVVCSVRTDNERAIRFSAIRQAEHVTQHGSIVRGLHQVVFGGEDSSDLVEFARAAPQPRGGEKPEAMLRWYGAARAWVDQRSDWVDSVAWNRDPSTLTAAEFLAEYAWAVYVSGFRANTVSVKWAALREAWRGFEPARIDRQARKDALKLIAHKSKTKAILSTAQLIASQGWPEFKRIYVVDSCTIGRLSWMGPANRRFLARNLQLEDVGKPDRWLIRFAERFGFATVDRALEVVEQGTGDRPGLSDAYIWAYLSENPDGLAH